MLIDIKNIEAFSKELKDSGKKIVFTNGCFDIIHPGHTKYLRRAKSLGDVLILGLNSDDSVRRLKGSERPLNCEKDRSEVLLLTMSLYSLKTLPTISFRLSNPMCLQRAATTKRKI